MSGGVVVKGCPICGELPGPVKELVPGKVWRLECGGYLLHGVNAMSWVSAEDCIKNWNRRPTPNPGETHE